MSLGLFIVFGVLLVPVYVMLAGWLVGHPRDLRMVGLGLVFLGSIVLMLIIATVASVPVGIIIPE